MCLMLTRLPRTGTAQPVKVGICASAIGRIPVVDQVRDGHPEHGLIQVRSTPNAPYPFRAIVSSTVLEGTVTTWVLSAAVLQAVCRDRAERRGGQGAPRWERLVVWAGLHGRRSGSSLSCRHSVAIDSAFK